MTGFEPAAPSSRTKCATVAPHPVESIVIDDLQRAADPLLPLRSEIDPVQPCSSPSGCASAPQRRIGAVSDLLLDLKLNTVCQEASCPNIGECRWWHSFSDHGAGLHRACPYCDIDFDKASALSIPPTGTVGGSGRRLGLKHVVITSVNRDDLLDGGATQFVACIEQVL